MNTQDEENASLWLSNYQESLQQLQEETATFALVGMIIAAMAILGDVVYFPNVYWNFWIMATLVGFAVLVWNIRRYSLLAANWLLVIGSFVTVLVIVKLYLLTPILWLLIIPVGLASLSFGYGTGAALAVVSTITVWFVPDSLLPVPPLIRSITITGIWCTVGMIWLILRPLLKAVQWAWTGYERNRRIMEQMRDYQVRLSETMEDLTQANIQLTRMTNHAQMLRQVAEENRQAKERFVANVSHELRTPLNMIIGFCEMITKEPDSYGGDIPPALLADLAVVLRNSQHLSGLINDVLDLSQLDAGRTALTKERISLADIIQAAVTAVRPLYVSKGLVLETEVPGDLPPVFCDRTRIREVVLNLLSNAGRFSAEGGVIVRARRRENDLVVSVTDTGPGIAKENLDKLFQPFEQLEGSVRRQYGGTGLGLSISKRFIELHDGQMKVDSQVGVGTTFTFSLPIDPPITLDPGPLRWVNPYATYEEHARPRKISAVHIRPHLVVVEKRNVLEKLLRRYMDKVEITPVEDLVEASRLLAERPAQALIINDLQAEEALNKLKNDIELPPGIPSLVCSVPGAEQAAGLPGVADYLLKPITHEALVSALNRLKTPVKTVLIVDDEPDAQQLFGRMLAAINPDYCILRVANGLEALEQIDLQLPDLILLDLMMPEMDGFQFLEAKSQRPEWLGIPVILISASDPAGHPIVSKTLTATCRNGLSIAQLLAGIEALIAILSAADASADPVLPAETPG